jgi:hypothetical protein
LKTVQLKRWLVCLTEYDMACLAHITAHHGYIRKADAMRFAIERMAERCGEPAAVKTYGDLAEAVGVPNQVKGDGGPKMPRWHQMFSESTMKGVDRIVRRHGLKHKAEAVRMALRVQAAEDGMTDPKPPAVPERRPSKPRRRRPKETAS